MFEFLQTCRRNSGFSSVILVPGAVLRSSRKQTRASGEASSAASGARNWGKPFPSGPQGSHREVPTKLLLPSGSTVTGRQLFAPKLVLFKV